MAWLGCGDIMFFWFMADCDCDCDCVAGVMYYEEACSSVCLQV